MRTFGLWLAVLVVLLLVAVVYPSPVSRMILGYAITSTRIAPPPAASTPTATPASGVVEEPAATPTAEAEGVRLALAKIKGGPEQAAAKAREAAVELPRRLRIPSLAMDAGFEFVGLAADGAMDVPKDPNKVAWYQLGPRPGEKGNAVAAGHVDWGGKAAVFWKLVDLKAGDMVEVVAADDRKYEFVVQWQKVYKAQGAPVGEVFGQSEGKEITLITCGGVFDRDSRQY